MGERTKSRREGEKQQKVISETDRRETRSGWGRGGVQSRAKYRGKSEENILADERAFSCFLAENCRTVRQPTRQTLIHPETG